MAPMVIGLMADAALASWHMSDRERCLRDFVVILQELNEVDQASSLNAAHCHAVCRHVLLWLDQEATGKKRLLAGGEEITIYPGIVSNPEPSPEIDKRHITPIEMAWYMLAAVENNSLLDVGITLRLATYLPKGPVVEGQFLLTFAIMKKSLGLHNIALFVAALGEVVTWWAFVKEQEDLKNSFDTLNVTYGSLPVAAPEQQHELTEATEQLVLGFVANSIFEEEFFEFGALIDAIEKSNDLKVRMVFLDCLRGSDIAVDYVTSAALLLVSYRQGIEENRTPSPIQVFELIFIVFQIVGKTINASAVAKSAFKWLSSKWDFISEHQRFLLKSPAMHEKFIAQALKSENDSVVNKTIGLLQAILPILGIGNESELKRALNKMLQS
ncbi:MAG: hypothetical protein KUG72_05890 [Pseudomonadales bacterium]|nr:hypothetical protein [Pseudomonadales bacterium]